jgi:hypothetical protein
MYLSEVKEDVDRVLDDLHMWQRAIASFHQAVDNRDSTIFHHTFTAPGRQSRHNIYTSPTPHN